MTLVPCLAVTVVTLYLAPIVMIFLFLFIGIFELNETNLPEFHRDLA